MRASLAALLLTLSGVAQATAGAAPDGSVGILAPAGEPGRPIVLRGELRHGGQPRADVEVHAYQADAGGLYDAGGGPGAAGSRLSVTVRTDARGRFELRTIFPGRYPQPASPPAHVHLLVRAPGAAERHVEVLFAEDPALAESRWQDWARRAGYPVVTLDAAAAVPTAQFVIELAR